MLKVAVLHYHLRRGGVTRVIETASTALAGAVDLAVIAGEEQDDPDAAFPNNITIPELAYTEGNAHPPSANAIADKIETALNKLWRGGADILHAHNPLLNKNSNFIEALRILQMRGVPLLLQEHDFAEDGRPNAYYQAAQYPANCHYAVINSRDKNALCRAGLSSDLVHFIPNAALPVPETDAPRPFARPYAYYPVRAIRRKNIGEALLLSLYFKNDEALVISLPPLSAIDLEPYANWKRFVKERNLNVVFEAGLTYSFPQLMRHAAYAISTSVNEGFGYAFLEPWTAGKAVFGRGLGFLLDDFSANGIRMPELYETLRVPIAAFNERAFADRWKALFLKGMKAYQKKPSENAITSAYTALTRERKIDFGTLDETAQTETLTRALDDIEMKRAILALNPALLELGDTEPLKKKVFTNDKQIRKAYSLPALKDALLETYRKALKGALPEAIDKSALLRIYADPKRFCPLKWNADV